MPATFLPPHGLTEQEEDNLALLVPVFNNAGPHGATLYIGNKITANDGDLLLQENITSTMNIAVNLYLEPLTLADGTAVRRTQIGLIDGHGNTPLHLLSAVLALDGILHQDSPGKPHYPPHRRGNVLVHCRGGRSRSLIVLAIYLFWRHRDEFPSLDAAINHIRDLRELTGGHPLPGMVRIAREACAIINTMPVSSQD